MSPNGMGSKHAPRRAVEVARAASAHTHRDHAIPLARADLIAHGVCERVRRRLDNRVYFVNQDNWSLPAVENSLLEGHNVAAAIQSRI